MKGNRVTQPRLADLVGRGNLFVLTGAGISTESGIPDYRRPDGTRRTVPMTFQEFCGSEAARARYWARSAVGWERFAAARPNIGHRAVASLQRAGLVGSLVTQNVDGLHQAGGSSAVVELHGSLDAVRCLACDLRFPRVDFQHELRRLNPHLPTDAELLADGDAEVAADVEGRFVLTGCPRCRSDLVKPDVVMFGESVAPALVSSCFNAVAASSAVLVLGSSLKVMSGYRFVLAARRAGKPIALVGLGTMRGEEHADLIVRQELGHTLTGVCDALNLSVP